MNRRNFTTLGLSGLAFGALSTTALAADKDDAARDKHHDHDEHMLRACAKACSDCQRECDSCATHCAHRLHDNAAHITTLQTCQDCADLCAAAAQIVSRGGPFARLACQACAEACDQCRQACEKMSGDEHMKQCADECRKCAQACREMTAAPKSA